MELIFFWDFFFLCVVLSIVGERGVFSPKGRRESCRVNFFCCFFLVCLFFFCSFLELFGKGCLPFSPTRPEKRKERSTKEKRRRKKKKKKIIVFFINCILTQTDNLYGIS